MEYSLEFATRVYEAAFYLKDSKGDQDECGRAIIYLSCLSLEISLKALL